MNFSVESSLNVFPSVSDGDFIISYQGEKGEPVFFSVRDVLGKELFSRRVVQEDERIIQSMNLTGKLSQGVYIVTASGADHILEKRIVIK